MLTDAQPTVADLISQRVATGVVPASVYTVFTADGTAFSGCYGAAATDGRPPTLDTAFRIASCTKSFTAAAILQLRDANALSLEDPITDFLDTGPWELPGSSPPPPPTVSALLSMSGGLAGDNPWADRQESMTTPAFEALCAGGFTLSSAPGTRYEYSNLGYALLGSVVERASGMAYRDFIARRLLHPLGLRHAAFHAAAVTAPGGIADGFRRLGDRWQPVPVTGPGAFSAIGGLFMTARDLTTWCRWLAAGYRLGADRDEVLAASSRRAMQTLHELDPPRGGGSIRAGGYGYGLDVELHDIGVVVSHRGGYPGFSAQMAWHPVSQIGVVVLENASYAQSPAVSALHRVVATVPAPTRVVWPVTIRARDEIERLLSGWDDTLADRIFADNVDLDQPRHRRRDDMVRAAAQVGFTDDCRHRPLDSCEPTSHSAAHLEWTVRGHRGTLRCAMTLTSLRPPRIQSITLHDNVLDNPHLETSTDDVATRR
ncbi:beta-lactamase family protein [Mycolicibacterium sp. S2-37]|uniref:serine hydrolase domain-containing protein n=1 Tax=Mycolicibacterium sp. S2-37 TaxID=2810297 RepID=UPI001A93F87C|nr:serine hydrolase domain-containing protein [Mycolicibacterium sp. S2-37]MBO0680448.1 beta-lactamase family protein [Mycolicibacterium sp. S2-37]